MNFNNLGWMMGWIRESWNSGKLFFGWLAMMRDGLSGWSGPEQNETLSRQPKKLKPDLPIERNAIDSHQTNEPQIRRKELGAWMMKFSAGKLFYSTGSETTRIGFRREMRTIHWRTSGEASLHNIVAQAGAGLGMPRDRGRLIFVRKLCTLVTGT